MWTMFHRRLCYDCGAKISIKIISCATYNQTLWYFINHTHCSMIYAYYKSNLRNDQFHKKV